MQVDRLYQMPTDNKPPIKGAWSESRDPFLKFCPNHIFGTGGARHFKFRVLIDTEEYECVHDILLPKGICSESRDLFKFWEINDNISETVLDRDMFAM